MIDAIIYQSQFIHSFIHSGCFYVTFSSLQLLRSTPKLQHWYRVGINMPKSYDVSEGLAQGPYVTSRVGFEPTTLRTQGTKLTTESTCPTWSWTTINYVFISNIVFNSSNPREKKKLYSLHRWNFSSPLIYLSILECATNYLLHMCTTTICKLCCFQGTFLFSTGDVYLQHPQPAYTLLLHLIALVWPLNQFINQLTNVPSQVVRWAHTRKLGMHVNFPLKNVFSHISYMAF